MAFHNSYYQVCMIFAPAVIATVLCPFTLAIRPYMAEYFWGGLPGEAINDALAAFLAPTGFVYAILFAYAYQNAITKKFEVERTAHKEMTYLTHMLKISLLLEKLGEEHSSEGGQHDDLHNKQALSKLREFVDGVCDTVNLLLIRFATEINDEPIDALPVSEWDIITKSGVDAAEGTSAAIFGQLLETIRGYDDNRADRRFWSSTGVHMIQWFALQAMAFFTFAAVAFIHANSARFELMLCFATVLGIVVMSLLVADLDRPFHGFMVIKLHGVVDVIRLLDHTCLRHSQTTLGRRKMSIIASADAPAWSAGPYSPDSPGASPIGSPGGTARNASSGGSSKLGSYWGSLKRRSTSKSKATGADYRPERSAVMAMQR